MNLLATYTDEQIAGLMEGLTSELAERKRSREEEKKNQVTVTVSFSELKSVWTRGTPSVKIANVHRYNFNGWEIYMGQLTAQYGGIFVTLGLDPDTQKILPFDYVPACARLILPLTSV